MFALRTDFVAENGSRSDGPRELLSRAPAANWMPLAALHDRYYHRLFVDYFHLFRQLTIFFFCDGRRRLWRSTQITFTSNPPSRFIRWRILSKDCKKKGSKQLILSWPISGECTFRSLWFTGSNDVTAHRIRMLSSFAQIDLPWQLSGRMI